MAEQPKDGDSPPAPPTNETSSARTKDECKIPLVHMLLICFYVFVCICTYGTCMFTYGPSIMQWAWDCSASGQPLFHAYNDECQRVLEESYRRGDQVRCAYVLRLIGSRTHTKRHLVDLVQITQSSICLQFCFVPFTSGRHRVDFSLGVQENTRTGSQPARRAQHTFVKYTFVTSCPHLCCMMPV